jgi:two-component system, cell cycle sensor histidine kinase and response regulator CckA
MTENGYPSQNTGGEHARHSRVLNRLGLHPMAHRPPLLGRFWIYAAAAFLLPVVVKLGLPAGESSLDELVWLITLVPAFLLSLHYGLRGAFAALLAGTALFLGVQLALTFTPTSTDLRVTVPIYIAYGALAISVGWLSEQLHDHYRYILELNATRKNQALETLSAGIAHDFNNILTAMVANADLMARDLTEEGAKERRELSDLREAARRGAGMVRNLLAFSRQGMLALRPVALDREVQQRMSLVRRLVPEGIHVTFEAEEGLPPVMADAGAVEGILTNLVTNARDAMPHGGELRIEVERGRLEREHLRQTGWGDPGDYVCLTVRDTGEGMNEEVLARVFDPFFSLKAPGEGSGLGMAMVYGLMKQHRGYIDIQSEPGAGTRAQAYFPVAKDRRAAAPPPKTTRPQGGEETIFLVEDDDAIREAAKRILERYGYTVHTAADGDEAVGRFYEVAPEVDLVLADVVLPGRTGPEFYDAVRRGPADPPVLFMSGYPARTIQARTSLDPGAPFLQKPWTVEELTAAVREVLDAQVPTR